MTKFSQHHLLYSLYFTKDHLVDNYEIHDSREHSGEEVAEDKVLREKALKEDNQKEPDTEDAKVGDVIHQQTAEIFPNASPYSVVPYQEPAECEADDDGTLE